MRAARGRRRGGRVPAAAAAAGRGGPTPAAAPPSSIGDAGCRRALPVQRSEELVHERDRHAALPDRRRDPLHRAERTSPQAKMPGTLVSSRYGSRSSVPAARHPHVGAGEHVAVRSRAISGGSQPVSASAPMKMNSPPDSSRGRLAGRARSRTSIASSACVAVDGGDLGPEQDVDVRHGGRAGRSGSSTCSSPAPPRGRGS